MLNCDSKTGEGESERETKETSERLLIQAFLFLISFFLLYINDLPNWSSKLSFRIFADDTNMFYTSNNLRNLESVMNEEFKLVVKYVLCHKQIIHKPFKDKLYPSLILKVKWKYKCK